MKNNKPMRILAASIVFFALNVNAQTRLNGISSKEILPANRTAFLYCYNNTMAYNNPAMAVLKTTATYKTTSTTVQNTTQAKQESGVCMFSNATEDELWVELDNKRLQAQNLQLEIYNANGEIVYDKKVEQNLHKVNVCDFTAGTFLVKLGDDVQKLVIE